MVKIHYSCFYDITEASLEIKSAKYLQTLAHTQKSKDCIGARKKKDCIATRIKISMGFRNTTLSAE